MNEFSDNQTFASFNATSHSEKLVDSHSPQDSNSESKIWLNNKSFTLELISKLDDHNLKKDNKRKSYDYMKLKSVKNSHSRKRYRLKRRFSKSIKLRDNTKLQSSIQSECNDFIFDTSSRFSVSNNSSISEIDIPNYIQLFDYRALYNNQFSKKSVFSKERYYNIPVQRVINITWHKNSCTNNDFSFSSEYIPIFDVKVPNESSNIISPVLDTELSIKISEYKKRLLIDPNNISLWIEFAEFEILSYNYIDGFESRITDKMSRTLNENCLERLKTALAFHPSSFSVITKYMTLYAKLYDYYKVVLKWREFLFLFPQSSILWNEYINFLCQSFDHFKLNELIKVYESAFKTLIAIIEEELLSSTPELDAEKNLVSLIIKYCHFLKVAGYDERAISSVLALIQFNSMPTLLTVKQQLIIEFETNWNTNNFVTVMGDDLFSYLIPCQLEKSIFDSNIKISDPIIDFDKSWVTVEQNRSKLWTLVPPNLITDKKITDKEKIISASVLVPLLFTIHSNDHLFQLLLHTMLLLGIPISMTSQVDKTFLDEEGFVVEVDAKGWISLFPINFTGKLIICSTNTHKLDYTTSMLTTEQTTLICNLLNYILPTIDYEHQTVLIITWLEYEINCLGYNLDDLKFNKFFRKQVKSILLVEIHKNNIALWGAFMIIYSYVSTIKDLLKIPATIFLQYSNSVSSFERLFCFHSTLYLCTTLEKRFCINTSTFKLYLLECISSNSTPQLDFMMSLLQEEPKIYSLSYSQVLKMKQNLWEKTKLSISKDNSSLFSLLYSSFYLAIDFSINRDRLVEYCVGFQSLWNFCNSSSLSLSQSKDRFMTFLLYTIVKLFLHSLSCDYLPKYIANFLLGMAFPYVLHNPYLYKLLRGTFGVHYINIALSNDSSLNGYKCQLSFYMSMLTPEFDQLSRQYIVNKLNTTLQNALHKYPCALILWVFNLDFIECVGINNLNYTAFFQAIKKHPGVKKLYTVWLSFDPERISYIISLMEEKEIRICCPIEEFILMQKAAI